MSKAGKNIIVGHNFLERHIKLHREKELSYEHVIIDRRDWEAVVEFFNKNPSLVRNFEKIDYVTFKQRPEDQPKFVVEIGTEGNCWLAKGDGDPPRTLVYDDASRYYSEIEARHSINKALDTHPLTYRQYRIVPIKK